MILSVDWQLAVTVVPLNPFGGIVCVWVRVLITASSALPIGSRAGICLPACLFAIFFTLDLVIALLDARGTGIVVSSIHHRDQARFYAKQVIEGEGQLELSPEEQEAIRVALAGEVPDRAEQRR